MKSFSLRHREMEENRGERDGLCKASHACSQGCVAAPRQKVQMALPAADVARPVTDACEEEHPPMVVYQPPGEAVDIFYPDTKT